MKKYILFVALPLLYFLSLSLGCFASSIPSLTATAETPTLKAGSYACILKDDTYLYASSNERSGLFLLPQTYYVKVLDPQPDFTKVEYGSDTATTKRLTGYCKTELLTPVDYLPVTPYFCYSFDVTYRLEDDNKLYPFLSEITLTCAYYGNYPIGSEVYCYALREDTFGYVRLPSDFTFIPNPEYAERFDKPTQAPAEPTTPQDSLPPVQIALIAILCLLAPILAALIIRPNKKQLVFEEE